MKTEVIHLGYKDNIDKTIVKGRLSLNEFNKILKADDKSNEGFNKSTFGYEWIVKTKNKV